MGAHFLTQYKSPLAYPAGIPPGFDPNHVAARKPIISTVAMGANHINLLRGNKGIITGAPVHRIDSLAGPILDFNLTNTDYIRFEGLPTTSMTQGTAGLIFKCVSTSGYNYLFSYGVSPGYHIWIGGDAVIRSEWGFAGTVNLNTAVAGETYFLCASYDGGAGTINSGLMNLRTGVYTTVSATGHGNPGSPASGAFYIGSSEWDNQISRNNTSAVMFSNSVISAGEIAQWAADPWSFWYPDPGDNWTAAQAAAAGNFVFAQAMAAMPVRNIMKGY